MMKNSFWRTGRVGPRRTRIEWPSPAQFLRQLALVLLIGGVWGAGLVGYLRLTEAEEIATSPADSRETERPDNDPGDAIAAAATFTPVPSPTSAPALAPPATPEPTLGAEEAPAEVPPTLTPAPATEEAPATPASPPTQTPSPLPPVETPVEPAVTPAPTEETTVGEDAPGVPATVSFANDVLPILERRCIKCHGGEKTEEGLVLKSYAELMAGSWNGLVIEPGNVEESYLIEMITTGKMPKKGPRLLPAEIRLITAWVEAGALDN